MFVTTKTVQKLASTLSKPSLNHAVAVSGGSDSLALLHAVQDWARAQEPVCTVTALIVDHGLRAESAQEAQWTARHAEKVGCQAEILPWLGVKPTKGKQEAARNARYDLMRQWCFDHGISVLWLGHHQEDQAETFLLRLARGSGVYGLSAMEAVREERGIIFARPFLELSKGQLQADLKERGQNWLEDPSNHDLAYDRVKFRQKQEDLTDLGLSPTRLAQTAQNLARARDSLLYFMQQWLGEHAQLDLSGACVLHRRALNLPALDVVLRGLYRIGQAVGGQLYPPRFDRLANLYDQLCAGQDATLMGCRWIRHQDHVIICRECRSLEVPQGVFTWAADDPDLQGLTPRLLGEDGRLAMQKFLADQGDEKPHPAILRAMISFWDEQGVFIVPHLGYNRQKGAPCPLVRLKQSF